jgi:hypothetical protein
MWVTLITTAMAASVCLSVVNLASQINKVTTHPLRNSPRRGMHRSGVTRRGRQASAPRRTRRGHISIQALSPRSKA